MGSTAIKTISCILKYIQFSMFLPSPYYFLATKLREVLYFQWQFSVHSFFCLPTRSLHSLAVMPVCYVKLVINYLSYQLTRTLLDNSGPISEDDNTMSGQLKTSRWNVSLFANPYLNPKPTKSKTSSSSARCSCISNIRTFIMKSIYFFETLYLYQCQCWNIIW